MAIVKTDSKHYVNIAEAIREKTGSATKFAPADMAGGVGEVYSKGKEDGYADGHTAGYTEGETAATAKAEAHNAAILSDCNAVFPTKGVETADTLAQVPQRIGEIKPYSDGYDVGMEDGKQTEWNAFWDAFQDNGKRVKYSYAFRDPGWNDETFKPKYNMVHDKWDNYVFYNCQITDLKGILERQGVTLDTTEVSGGTHWFSAAQKLTRIPPLDLRSMASCLSMFQNCYALEEIELNNVREDLTGNNAFVGCNALKHLKVTGTIGTSVFNLSNSSLLTNESVQNIIDHLKDLTGQTAQKVTFHSSVIVNLTDEQISTMVAKNWTF